MSLSRGGFQVSAPTHFPSLSFLPFDGMCKIANVLVISVSAIKWKGVAPIVLNSAMTFYVWC